jgi:uridylate kinase
MADPLYRRVIVKLSGEALAGAQGYGIDQKIVERLAGDLVAAAALGIELGVVVGGGNIFRGVEVSSRGVPRPVGDTMGMLATVMNCLTLEAAIERQGREARTLSALAMPSVCETYNRKRALKNLGKGRVVLLAAGTGNPFFTTDTTAVLRAAELEARSSKRPMSMVSTALIRRKTPMPSVTTSSAIRRRSKRTSRSWIRRPSRLPGKIVYLSSSSRSPRAAR